MLADILSGFMLIIIPIGLMVATGFFMWCLFQLIKEMIS